MIDNLPNELKVGICLFINLQTVGRLACVSKNWQAIADDELVWSPPLHLLTEYTHPDKSAKAISREIIRLSRINALSRVEEAKANSETAKLILLTPILVKEMRQIDLPGITASSLDTAKFVFHAPELVMQLEEEDLLAIATSNPEISKYMLQTPSLVERLSADTLEKIAWAEAANALLIAQDPEVAPNFRPTM